MDPVFKHLSLEPELVCNFLGVFARFEYALKAASFVNGDHRHADANWDTFAATIAKRFDASASADLRAAVDYLFAQPPQKLVLLKTKIAWAPFPLDPHQSQSQQVLLMVRQVRNNLFHGGKFLRTATDPDRDKLLLEHSLTVLRACLPLDNRVAEAYAK